MKRTNPARLVLTRVIGGAALCHALAPVSWADAPQVVVKTVEQEVVQGRVKSLTLTDGLLVQVNGDEQRVALADLVRLTVPGSRSEGGRRGAVFTLRNGDVIHGRVVGGGQDVVDIEALDVGRVRLPLDVIARVDTARGVEPSFEELVRWLDRADGREDRVLLTNGDVIRGFVTGIDTDGVTVDAAMGEATLARRLVVAIRLASTPAAEIKKPYAILTLRHGDRLTALSLDWSDGAVKAVLSAGPEVTIDETRVLRVEFVGGRWTWLSSQAPISFEHTAMLSLPWEYRQDRNVLGGTMTVAGERFEHGIGVHSRSSLIYDLKGAYGHFVTSFGMDDDSGPLGDVTVHVSVDGKRRFSQEHVRRGTLFGPVRLDVARAKRVELQVDYGENGDIQDRFNWVEPALIR